jgi:hypothetical protein
MIPLFKKDLRNAKNSFWAGLLLGVPLFLLLAISNQTEPDQFVSWRTAFWFSLFFASTAIFYRSFGLECENQNFGVYSAIKIQPWKILLSQSLVQALSFFLLGSIYILLAILWWSPTDLDLSLFFLILTSVSFTLAPTASFIGLLLQKEREILFPLFYLPFASPVIIGAHILSLGESTTWFYILGIFALVGGFLSFLLFEFFFDELTEV